jgi:nitrate reductase delta subunit
VTAAAPDPAVFEALAAVLEYPDDGFRERLAASAGAVGALAPDLAAGLAPLALRAEASPPGAIEELYAQTFDWDPARCLEIGWHLHGEQYDRGAFLVRMRDALRRAGLEEGRELPDHLATALRLLARFPEEDAVAFARESLGPALEKMAAGFGDAQNPYGDVVRAVRAAVAPLAAPPAEEAAR